MKANRRHTAALSILVLYALILALFTWTPDNPGDTSKDLKAELDITDINHLNKGYLPLDSGWEFFWSKFLQPGNPDRISPDLISPAGEWNSLSLHDEKLPGQGFGTYRKIIAHNPGQDLSLMTGRIYSSYRLYINGRLAAAAGDPGKDSSSTRHNYAPQIVKITNTADNRAEIMLHISNFAHYKGGLCSYEPIYIGKPDAIASLFQKRAITYVVFLGILSMGIIFNFLLFLFRRNEPLYLYLALICLTSTIVISLDLGYYSLDANLIANWLIREKINSAVQALGTLFYLLFLERIFRKEFSPRFLHAAVIIFPAITLLTLALPVAAGLRIFRIYLVLMAGTIAYCLYVLLRSIIKRNTSVNYLAVAYLVISITAIIQYINYQNQAYFLDIIPILHTVVIIIVLTNTVYLSMHYKRALRKATVLSGRLEKKVSQRTRELELSRNIIATINGEQKELLRLLCNDLSGPFTTLTDIIHKLKNYPEDFERYREREIGEAEQTLEESLLLIKNINGSGDLSETRANPRKVSLQEILTLTESLSQEMLNKKQIRLEATADQNLTIYIEPALFVHAVLLNLIGNAVKYSSPGSCIYIKAEKFGHMIKMSIRDEGIGMPQLMADKILVNPGNYRRNGTSGEIGAGFGLRLAHKFILLFNGEIDIESKENSGSTVILKLPSDFPLKGMFKNEAGE